MKGRTLSSNIVNGGNGYETRQSSLLYAFVLSFGLDPAQQQQQQQQQQQTLFPHLEITVD